MQLLGSIGIGLVSGWLVGYADGRMQRPVITIIALIIALLLLAISIYFLAAWPAPAFFGAATLISLLTHQLWRQELKRRYR